jgi:hypothetical protein
VVFHFQSNILVRSFRVKVGLLSEPAEEKRLSNAVIIGVVTGVSATVAIFAGVVVFMFRHRRDQNLSDLSSSSVQRDQKKTLDATEMPTTSPEEPPPDKPSDDEEAIESLSNFNMQDIDDQPLIWI